MFQILPEEILQNLFQYSIFQVLVLNQWKRFIYDFRRIDFPRINIVLNISLITRIFFSEAMILRVYITFLPTSQKRVWVKLFFSFLLITSSKIHLLLRNIFLQTDKDVVKKVHIHFSENIVSEKNGLHQFFAPTQMH